MRSICIFLTDPLDTFLKKGEIKKGYYNPAGYFDTIHYISFADHDANEADVRSLAGRACSKIYPIGRINALNVLPMLFRAFMLVRMLKPSLIRAYDPSLRGFMSVIIGKALGIPVAISLHAEMDDQRKFDSRMSLRIRIAFESVSIRLADAVICVTDYVKAYALKYGARFAVTIYNGVDLDRFGASARTDVLPNNAVLCVGRLDKQKYQECLIRAIASLKANLVIIGDGSEAERLRRLAESIGVSDRVTFIRSVPHAEIHDYYASSKVFAIATHYEGFCIPVIEAMASGLPVVASRIPPIEEIVGGAGLLAENYPEEFRSRIDLLLRDSSERERFAREGKSRACMFDIRINEERQREVYERLLEGRASEAGCV